MPENPHKTFLKTERRKDRIAALLVPGWLAGVLGVSFTGQYLLGADTFHTVARVMTYLLFVVGIMMAAWNLIRSEQIDRDITDRTWDAWRQREQDNGKEFAEAVVVNAREIRSFARATYSAWLILGTSLVATMFWWRQ